MWCASFADYAKLAADGPSNLVERGAQVVEQLAVRANLPYQGAPSPAVIVRRRDRRAVDLRRRRLMCHHPAEHG
jgi:hypothetical protein